MTNTKTRLFAVGLLGLVGCKNDGRPPEPASAPNLVSFAFAYPGELSRTITTYEETRGDALRRCTEAMELASSVKDPVDVDTWRALLDAAEKSGKSRWFAERQAESASFQRVLRERDEEIAKRTAGSAQFTAEQKGCAAGADVGGAAASGLRRAVDKRLEERAHEANEAHDLLAQRKDVLGKANLAPLGKQVDAIAHATYLVSVALPLLAHERATLAAESATVRRTLEAAIAAGEEARTSGSDADKKASEERLRGLKSALSDLGTLEPKLVVDPEATAREIAETREGCAEILDALRKEVSGRAK